MFSRIFATPSVTAPAPIATKNGRPVGRSGEAREDERAPADRERALRRDHALDVAAVALAERRRGCRLRSGRLLFRTLRGPSFSSSQIDFDVARRGADARLDARAGLVDATSPVRRSRTLPFIIVASHEWQMPMRQPCGAFTPARSATARSGVRARVELALLLREPNATAARVGARRASFGRKRSMRTLRDARRRPLRGATRARRPTPRARAKSGASASSVSATELPNSSRPRASSRSSADSPGNRARARAISRAKITSLVVRA